MILFGFLLTLNSCQKGSDKEVTSFQGFEWGTHSQAIIEELAYFNYHVWKACTQEEMRNDKDWKLLRSRWILCNKDDHSDP